MKTKPRAIGTATETAVVRFLVPNGFPHAERRSLKGALDQGDVTGTPGICWEVKGGVAAKMASDGQVAEWLAETEKERRASRSDVGILVLQRSGHGPANAGSWWAVLSTADLDVLLKRSPAAPTVDCPVRLHLWAAVALLRNAGYGAPIEATLVTA